ncbi:MAG: alpha-amylase [Lachnospiraceae bacterium]|nr:alpha-amylase [Lachnospiraceae bacterium]
MKKRIIASLLTVTMLVSVLSAGCGGTTQNEPDTTGSEIATSIEEQEPAITALTYMEQYNTAPQQVTDDNYRTYYEVFVYSFFDSDGDGIGDLKGLTEKLDYINDGDPTTTTDLGCNGIWMMPIMPSPSYHKYDVIDYYEIDPQYGTMEDFKEFVAECDKRGIRVMIDLVMNHSSSEHEWFQTAYEYMQSLPAGAEPDLEECPYVDYYFFGKQQTTGYAPVEGTEWYYEGQFWSGMPDLNLDNPAVRAEFEAIVDYWLDLGVTGFRLDAAKEFFSGEDEKNIEVLTWFNDYVKSKNEDVYIVAEVWNNMALYSAYHASGVSCFNFSFAENSGTIATAIKEGNGRMFANRLVSAYESFASFNPNYIDSPFYTNHDMGRSAGYYSNDYAFQQVKMAQGMNLLMSGSAFLYYGEEIGMRGSGRDENKRAPMYWSADDAMEGLCDGPKDMEAFDMKYPSLEEQNADGNSIYHFVKQAILLRNQFPALSHGVVEVEEALMEDKSIGAMKKTYGDEEVLLIYNLAAESKTVDLSAVTCMEGELVIGGVLLTSAEDIVKEGNIVTLPAYSVIVLTK